MINFLHTFQPNPFLISFGSIHIYWYGLFIVLGILLAILTALKLSSYYKIKKETIIDLAFYLIIGGIIGARIYHILLEWQYYSGHPLNIFKIWQGGLAIHGAIFAGLAIIWHFAKKYQHNPWLLIAIVAPSLALAQAIGRWGNYFNQELFGKPTSMPWGIPIDLINRPIKYINNDFFHPAFLYESIGNFLIFLILISFHIWIIKKNKFNNFCYLLSVICYLILYSVLRFSLEFIRIDQTYIIFGLRFPQLISLLIITLSIAFLILLKFEKHDVIK
ncbi:MAG: prolipoprotein diacylglyceryl transferase [Patescibacteria group bacterium]|nr:prolipoprotein diacylglyceryl transferase [Patescibacteria group bacterium]